MNIRNPILPFLNEARSNVERLRAEIAALSIEMGKEEARLSAFELSSQQFEMSQAKSQSTSTMEPKRKRHRLPDSDWQFVMQTAHHKHDNEFGYEDIITLANSIGIEVNQGSLRTKMMNYVNSHYLDRRGAGRFSITPEGMKFFQVSAKGADENERPQNDLLAPQNAAGGGVAAPPPAWINP